MQFSRQCNTVCVCAVAPFFAGRHVRAHPLACAGAPLRMSLSLAGCERENNNASSSRLPRGGARGALQPCEPAAAAAAPPPPLSCQALQVELRETRQPSSAAKSSNNVALHSAHCLEGLSLSCDLPGQVMAAAI